MACNDEIHVGDIGITYRGEIKKNGEPWDPGSPDITELIFQMPNGDVVRKTAILTTDGSPASRWFLSYEVQPGDGIGSPGEFHDNPGVFQVEGYLHWVDGKQSHSHIQTEDSDGQELRVFPNLD